MRFFVLTIALFVMLGCSSMETLRDDYLGADEYDGATLHELKQDIKYDLLGMERPLLEKYEKNSVIFIAQNRLSLGEYKDKFYLSEAYIDQEPSMPESFPYVFVLIPPKPEIKEFKGQMYLFVFRRLDLGTILYEGLFTPKKGDSFYRYNDIIKELTLQ